MKRLIKPLSKSLATGSFQLNAHSKPLIAIILNLVWCHSSHTGLIQGDHFVIGEKHIALFGDHHEAGTHAVQTAEAENFVAALKETSPFRKGSVTVLYEKGGNYAKIGREENDKHILLSLEAELAKQGLNDVTVVDAEIRKVGITAHKILKEPEVFIKFPENALEMTWEEIIEERMTVGEIEDSERRRTHRYFEDGPLVNQVTFQDIIDSYRSFFASISDFEKKHTNDAGFSNFCFTISSSYRDYEHLIQLMHRHHISPETNLVQFAVAQRKAEYTSAEITQRALRMQFSETIRVMFYGLFETHLFQQIYEQSGNNIIVLAGAAHTTELRNMLKGIGAVRSISYTETTITEANAEFRGGINGRRIQIKLLSKSQLIALLKGYSFSNSLWQAAEEILTQSITFVVINLGGSLCPKKSPEKE